MRSRSDVEVVDRPLRLQGSQIEPLPFKVGFCFVVSAESRHRL